MVVKTGKSEVYMLVCGSGSTAITSTDAWQLSNTAVTAYEDAVQRFLELFLGLRWLDQNRRHTGGSTSDGGFVKDK